MDARKKKKLEQAGWKVGTVQEFLNISEEEAALVEVKLRLARAVVRERNAQRLTQAALAKRIRSSQSRVAKIENADRTVSMDLMVKTLAALGKEPAAIGRIISKPREQARLR